MKKQIILLLTFMFVLFVGLQTVTFAAGEEINGYVVYQADFNTLENTATVADIQSYLSGIFTNTDSQPFYKVIGPNSTWYQSTVPGGGTLPSDLKEKQSLTIEDGRLKLSKFSSSLQSLLSFYIPTVTSVPVEISMDISTASNFADGTNVTFLTLYNDAEAGGRFSIANGKLSYSISGYTPNWNYDFKAGDHNIKFHLPFAVQKSTAVNFTVDGAYRAGTGHRMGGFNRIVMHLPQTCPTNAIDENSNEGVEIYIDNISIKTAIEPMIEKVDIGGNEVNDGDTATEVNTLTVIFTGPITETEAEKIQLLKNDVLLDSDFVLSEDGKKMTFTGSLQYSCAYRIVMNDDIKSVNGLYFPETSVSFHTKHEASPIIPGDVVITDAVTSEPVTDLSTADEVYIASTFVNNTQIIQNGSMIIALYRDGMMEKIEYKTLPIAANQSEVLGITLQMPEDKSGLTMKVMKWESYHTMRPFLAATIQSIS